MNKFLIYFICMSFIFIGAMCYTIASFYHLKFNYQWSFSKALMIAIPFILIEYTFTLHGNYFAYKYLDVSPSNILIFTICCYFICIWIFNYFVMKIKWDSKHAFTEFIAFILILTAFYISNVVH